MKLVDEPLNGMALYIQFSKRQSEILKGNTDLTGANTQKMIRRMVDYWDENHPLDKATAGLLSELG